jgi:hypothetical protein
MGTFNIITETRYQETMYKDQAKSSVRQAQKREAGIRTATNKLTKEQVEEIKQKRKTGMTYQSLGDEYGCNRRTIEKICVGKTYQ